MKPSGQGTYVSILDKEYCVNCPEDKVASLQEAAHHLDAQMRKIRKSGKVIGLERIAVMAALNMTYELLTLKDNPEKPVPVDDFSNRIKLLHNRIDDVLAKAPIKPLQHTQPDAVYAQETAQVRADQLKVTEKEL